MATTFLRIDAISGATYSGASLVPKPFGGKPPFTYTADVSALPWLTFNRASGTFDFTAPDVGAYSFPYTVTDALGVTLSKTGNIIVRAANGVIQPQQSGSSIGTPGATNWNFVGAAVANDGTTATVTVTAGLSDAPSNSNTYARKGGAWVSIGVTVNTVTGSTTVASNTVTVVNAATSTQTLPTAPALGDTCEFDCLPVCAALTISPNGGTIGGVSGSMTCDVYKPDGSVINLTLRCVNATTKDWAII